ncbi:sulfotransferase [Waterburya agarophytonicola K14]|uniref:Sulfotransferase n=1 Tax=Waterburya agarophytonicola KI4 TaxID=2874699 RepID=A0A964BLN6_9CYAN|nr:sulfotransferase [Waterburya agarophytonicola]MCC0175665.1 sulfotransferase [Waterburya agarophytonicola KI4]
MSIQSTNKIHSPIIVVGRPRSGSSLFTRLLSENPDLCMINDFYYLQYVDALAGFDRQDSTLIKSLANQIFSTLKNRQKPDNLNKAGIEFGSLLNSEQTKDLKKFVDLCSARDDLNWSSLFATIMQYNAHLFGKKIWGYNTPQDYLHLPKLEQAFPQAKIIFVMRDPRAVLRSYKYMDYLENYHDPARYHPFLQAIAWKSAMKSFLSNQERENFMLVKYEDLVKDANRVLAEVGDFIGVNFPPVNLQSFGSNSTFKNKAKKQLSNTEIWICEKTVGEEMQVAGYSLDNISPAREDLGYIFYVTVRSCLFYLKNAIASSDIRKRIFNLAITVLSNKNHKNYY